MIVGIIIFLFIILVVVATFSPFLTSVAHSKKGKKVKKIIFSDKIINLMCYLGIANHILKPINILIAPEPSTIETVSRNILYYPYIWAYNILMILAFYLILKRKRNGLYLYFISLIVTFPLNIFFQVFNGQNITSMVIIYVLGIAGTIWIARNIWERFS